MSVAAFLCSLVQGDPAGLEQRIRGVARYWQWCLAGAEDQEALSTMLRQRPHLAHAQQVAEQKLQSLRRTLLALLKEQMAASTSQDTLQSAHQRIRLPVDLMQQRVNTLLALQQLEERCELLSRGLVIAEGDALAAVPQHKSKRTSRGAPKTPSILALRK